MNRDFNKHFIFSIVSCFLLLSGFQLKAQKRIIDSLRIELIKNTPDTTRIHLLTSLAFYLRAADPREARQLRRRVFILSKKINYDKGMGWYFYLEGINLASQNKFLPSLKAEFKAIEIGHKIKDYDLIGRAYNTIGLNHIRLEDHKNAMRAFNTALSYISHSTELSIKPALLINIGELYIKQRKYQSALKSFGRSRDIYLSMKDKYGLSLTYLATGRVHYILKDYKRAIMNADLALSVASEINYSRTILNSLILLGTSHIYLNNLPLAREYLERSLKAATLKNIQDEKLRLYESFARLSEREGNFKDAFQYKKNYILLYDTLFNINRSRLIREYQVKFQTEQKETENKILRNQQLLIQNKIKQRNQALYLTLGVLMGFIIFSVTMFWGNKKIKQKNSLLTEQKNQILKQKNNVEQINQIKDKLFSVIAHDLRSPFASMKSMMDMYDEGMVSKEDLDFFFKEIRKDIGFNSLLLDNLLIWAKSQLQGFKIDPKPVSINRLSSQVLYHYKKHIESKEITIINEIPDNTIAHADYEMVNTVIRNLIGNAIKFTPKKGQIGLFCSTVGDELLMKITDTGIGISEENKAKLFQEVFFTTQGLNKEKGTGLGLQICKEFIEKNKGRIWVDSQLGAGSTFCFTLQKSKELSADLMDNGEETYEAAKDSAKEALRGNIDFQHNYDRYELLSKASNETIWDSELLNKEISWNEALNANFGYPDEKTSIEWKDEKIHPEDFQKVKKSIQVAISSKLTNWECEYRFLCSDGSYKYVLDRGLILYDDNQHVYRLMGIMQDINNQKNRLKEIQRLSLVATKVNNIVLITDSEDRILWANKAFENHTHYSLTEIIGEQPQQFLSGKETNKLVLKDMEHYFQENKDFSVELINYTKEGEPYWVQIDTTRFQDPISFKTGYVSIQTVITERKENERILSERNKTLSEIAYICSHEVTNPLSSIVELIAVLNSGNLKTEKIEEYAGLLNDSAEMLDCLIYKIHNEISKIEKEAV